MPFQSKTHCKVMTSVAGFTENGFYFKILRTQFSNDELVTLFIDFIFKELEEPRLLEK